MMKKLIDILNPFKRDRKVNRAFYNLFFQFGKEDFYATNNIDLYMVSDVRSRTRKGVLEVRVVTSRPGILIGKGGSKITALQDELSENLGRECKILVVENDIWKFDRYGK